MSISLILPFARKSLHFCPRHFSARTFNTACVKRSSWLTTSRRLRWGLTSGAVIATAAALVPIYADTDDNEEKPTQRKLTPISSLVRSYFVYTTCSIPGLVDWSNTILSTLLSVPLVKHIAAALVRVTFFNQFVGGDSVIETLPVLERLREENKGTILNYSVEVDEAEAAGNAKKDSVPVHKQGVEEMVHSIDVVADFEDRHAKADRSRGTCIAIKLSALLPNPQSLLNFSEYLVNSRPQSSPPVPFPGMPHATDLDVLNTRLIKNTPLTDQDIADLKELHQDLIRICTRAQERGIRVLVDAEHSWYQPGVDALTLALMRQFNKLPTDQSGSSNAVQPVVYNTFQAYLRRQPEYIRQSLADAKAHKYALGVKLVRGAYHPLETASHASRVTGDGDTSGHKSLSISPDPEPPVWSTKAETDAAYNDSVKVLIEEVARDVEGSHKLSRSSPFSSSGAKGNDRATAPSIGVLFGSHNWDSQKLVLDELVKKGLATIVGSLDNGDPIAKIGDEVIQRVSVAQLYGMSDALTDYIVNRTRSSSPFVLKYVPYGSLTEVMPYLSRRAIENKSVLSGGAAAEERKYAASEIKKRICG